MEIGESVLVSSYEQLRRSCSYDGAEICELVGIYLLTHLATMIKKSYCRFYRDDDLVILRNVNGQQTYKSLKISFRFRIDIKVVDFLDITFNLNSGTYKPYKQTNDPLLCKSKISNLLPQIISRLPVIFGDILSRNS